MIYQSKSEIQSIQWLWNFLYEVSENNPNRDNFIGQLDEKLKNAIVNSVELTEKIQSKNTEIPKYYDAKNIQVERRQEFGSSQLNTNNSFNGCFKAPVKAQAFLRQFSSVYAIGRKQEPLTESMLKEWHYAVHSTVGQLRSIFLTSHGHSTYAKKNRYLIEVENWSLTDEIKIDEDKKFLEPQRIQAEMNNFITDLNAALNAASNGKINPILLATVAGKILIGIHPFRNGNGRLCNLLETYILAYCKYPIYSSSNRGGRIACYYFGSSSDRTIQTPAQEKPLHQPQQVASSSIDEENEKDTDDAEEIEWNGSDDENENKNFLNTKKVLKIPDDPNIYQNTFALTESITGMINGIERTMEFYEPKNLDSNYKNS